MYFYNAYSFYYLCCRCNEVCSMHRVLFLGYSLNVCSTGYILCDSKRDDSMRRYALGSRLVSGYVMSLYQFLFRLELDVYVILVVKCAMLFINYCNYYFLSHLCKNVVDAILYFC